MIACESVEATKDKTRNEKNDRFRRPCCLRSIIDYCRHQASLVILVRAGPGRSLEARGTYPAKIDPPPPHNPPKDSVCCKIL